MLSIVAIAALAIGGAVVASSPASADPASDPIPAGLYLDSPWVAPGGTSWVSLVGDTGCSDGGITSANFVDSDGSVALSGAGFGDGYWESYAFAFVDETTNVPFPTGTHGAVSGQLVITCKSNGGGPDASYSMPLTVSPTPPSSPFHSWGQWTWYTPGDITPGAPVTINALGFKPGETTTVALFDSTIFYDDNQGDDLTGATTAGIPVVADGSGAVTAQTEIPAGWSSGDTMDLVIAGGSSHYMLVSGAGQLPFGDPTLNLTDTGSAFPGGAVAVAAGGFDPSETVTVALDSPSAPGVTLGTFVADSSGLISGSVYLPTSLSPGSYRVWAGSKTSSYVLLSAPLTIHPAPTSSRLAGTDRYQTAAAVSQSYAPFADGTGTVYLTDGLAFPDALGAGALAAEIGAPVLLTGPNSLPDAVRSELVRLHPAHVKVVGGTGAVSDAVLNDVQKLPFAHDTPRIGGADRYSTNRLLISDALNHASTVYIAVGSNFPDALAAGPAAASVDGAVVLVDGSASTLDSSTVHLLTGLGVTKVRLVGGTGVLSTGIENQLKGMYPGNVARYAGADRYNTAAQIVAAAWPTTAPKVIMASGADFPDALAAGALGLPMLTSQPNCVPAVVLARIGALEASEVTLVGGASALSDGVANFKHC